MEKFLPLFPLNLVVYPNEKLNLHIFEPRYRQLISECVADRSSFGIPAYINDKLESYGTEMEVLAVKKLYEDGRMDIETMGLRVFRILDFTNPVPDKLYAGGNVALVDNSSYAPEDLVSQLLEQVQQLYSLLQLKVQFTVLSDQYLSYELAHKIGLSIEQEYELLTIPSEPERQQYLLNHLKQTIPVVAQLERTKERIRMNGHFRHFDPLTF
jgi:Lon protease-like protein